MNGSARDAKPDAAARHSVDMEGSEAADTDGLDSEDGSSAHDESDEASDGDDADDGVTEAAAAERRRSSAAATPSGRPALTGVLLRAAGCSSQSVLANGLGRRSQ